MLLTSTQSCDYSIIMFMINQNKGLSSLIVLSQCKVLNWLCIQFNKYTSHLMLSSHRSWTKVGKFLQHLYLARKMFLQWAVFTCIWIKACHWPKQSWKAMIHTGNDSTYTIISLTRKPRWTSSVHTLWCTGLVNPPQTVRIYLTIHHVVKYKSLALLAFSTNHTSVHSYNDNYTKRCARIGFVQQYPVCTLSRMSLYVFFVLQRLNTISRYNTAKRNEFQSVQRSQHFFLCPSTR